jgi:glycosyltransferase involved in cell wall biosynthesis
MRPKAIRSGRRGGQSNLRDPSLPLRVVHVITSLGPGGAERQVEYLCRDTRHHLSVVCLYERGLVSDAITAAGGDVKVIGMHGLAKLTAVVRLGRVLRHEAPDVVNVHLLSGQLFGVLAARLARVPVVVSTEHSLMDNSIEGRRKSRWLRFVYLGLERLSSHTVAVSTTTWYRLRDWGVLASRMTVIDDAIDFEAVGFDARARNEVRSEQNFPPDAFVVGAVGRLVPVKRFESLLTAAAPLLRRRDGHLIIIGEGPQHPRLEELAVALGIGNRVHLLGPQPDVGRFLSAFDVFASPSRDETFGMAILESLGNGLPSVFVQCPPLEHDDHRPTWMIKAEGDVPSIAEAIERLSDLPRQHPPVNLLAPYAVDRLAAAYDDLYELLLHPTAAADRPARMPDPASSRVRAGG